MEVAREYQKRCIPVNAIVIDFFHWTEYGTFDFWGQQTYIDMTNPDARSFVWEQIKKTYIEYGIRTFWLDAAEPEVHPQQFNNLKTYAGNMVRSFGTAT